MAATQISPESFRVPLVDLSRFTNGAAVERQLVAEEWDSAFRDVGFCLLTGYEDLLPRTTIDMLRSQALPFFSQEPSIKQRAYVDGMVGYLGPGAENVAASAGPTIAGPDLVESLNLTGYQEPGSEWRAANAEAECPWVATQPGLPGELRMVGARYWGGATRLMMALMELSEEALELRPGELSSSFQMPGCLLRFAYYPSYPALLRQQDGARDVTDNQQRCE